MSKPVSYAPLSPSLYLFSGLPGSGKSTLAQLLSIRLRGAYLRIDTIEQSLRDLCGIEVEGEGYQLAYRLAADQLRLGNSVVADSCNPIALTRREWEGVAQRCGLPWMNIEVICSDIEEHRRRVETRISTVPGLVLPTWGEVTKREYEGWGEGSRRVQIDTAGISPEVAFERLWHRISE